jgi:hypothetical protein
MQPIGVSPEPNAGQQAYLMALQDQIKQSQKSEADAMAGYDRPRSQSGGNSMDDSIGGLIGAIAPIAMAFI